jgi:phosphoglycerate dehydrogenase-like enzyme
MNILPEGDNIVFQSHSSAAQGATGLGILATHSPTESNWGGVAEGTITAMLTMLKKARERDRHLKEGKPWRGQHLQGT